MNLQEATERIKAILHQEIAPNTLRKACASGRLKGVRKGEGTLHVRRTEWDVKEEDLLQFVQEEYHPRPTRRIAKDNMVHIPNKLKSTIIQISINDKELEEPTEAKVFYRVVEHLYQHTLPIHGNKLEKYDTRIVEAKIKSKVKAEALVSKLQAEVEAGKLSDQLVYQVESYVSSNKVR